MDVPGRSRTAVEAWIVHRLAWGFSYIVLDVASWHLAKAFARSSRALRRRCIPFDAAQLIFVKARRAGAYDNTAGPQNGTTAVHNRIDVADAYWPSLERRVTLKVDAAMRDTEEAREWLAPRLRGLERLARRGGGRRQTIQIIASARRLLGDRSTVDPASDPFVHVQDAAP